MPPWPRPPSMPTRPRPAGLRPASSGLGARVGCGPYLCLAARSRWPARSHCSPRQPSGTATRPQQGARRHSVRKRSQDAGVRPSTEPPHLHLRLCPIRLEPGKYVLPGWDTWQEPQETHSPGMGQMATAWASKPTHGRPSGHGRMGAAGANREAGVGGVGGPWSPGRPGRGSKIQGALGDRALKEVGGRRGHQAQSGSAGHRPAGSECQHGRNGTVCRGNGNL